MISGSSLIELAGQCSFISKLSLAQADYFARHYDGLDESLTLILLMLQYKLEQGDVCLRVDSLVSLQDLVETWRGSCRLKLSRSNVTQYEQDTAFVETAAALTGELSVSLLYELLSKAPFIGSDTDADKPLVLSLRRLYFRRYYLYEKQAAVYAGSRGRLPYYEDHKELMRRALDILFPAEPAAADEVDWQKAAAALAALNSFTIISGGPGTGKTTTVIRLLLLLTALDPALRVIELAAPTGKAAARMAESINRQLSAADGRLMQAAVKLAALTGEKHGTALLELIPREAQTVHRLLKVRPHQVSIGYDARSPLPVDIVVIDEVSMVDLSLFNKLLSALSPHTILILLGDKDQLCSVEAGSVLGDLAAGLTAGCPHLSAKTAERLAFLCGVSTARLKQGVLTDNAVLLTKSHRFSASSGIGRLAGIVNSLPSRLAEHGRPGQQPVSPESAALRRSKAADIAALVRNSADLAYQRFDTSPHELKVFTRRLAAACLGLSLDGEPLMAGRSTFAPFIEYLAARQFCLTDREAEAAFALLDKFRVLCSNRAGFTGEVSLNQLIEQELRQRWHLPQQTDFPGRVVLIVRNDPLLNVTNGDVGFEAFERMEDGSQGALRIFLPGDRSGGVKKISPVFIPDVESGFALTVHKAQGSEYEHVLCVLSTEYNPVLTKELVYTAVTRAKQALTLAGPKFGDSWEHDVLLDACMHLVRRESALSLRLYGELAG